jgi:hypothetical protein
MGRLFLIELVSIHHTHPDQPEGPPMTTHTRTTPLARIALLSTLGLAVATVRADQLAYESFSYGASANLQGANGGTGWGSAWFKLSSIPTGVTLDSLASPGMTPAGGSAFTAAFPSADYTRYSRAIAPYAAPTNTVYISFLFRPNAGFGVGGGLAFGTWDNGMIVGLAPGSGHYGLSGFQGPSSLSSTQVAQNETALLVASAHRNANNTITWSLHVNPATDEAEPSMADATMTIPGSALPAALVLYNDGGFSTDEIRVATTWHEALGQPPQACDGDLNGNGLVDAADLALLLGQWGTSGSADFDGSGVVDGADLAIVLGAWGPCA